MTIYTCKSMSACDKLVFRANARLFISWFLLNRAQKTVLLDFAKSLLILSNVSRLKHCLVLRLISKFVVNR